MLVCVCVCFFWGGLGGGGGDDQDEVISGDSGDSRGLCLTGSGAGAIQQPITMPVGACIEPGSHMLWRLGCEGGGY